MPSEEAHFSAWIDESVVEPSGAAVGAYVLAVSIIPVGREVELRDRLRGLLTGKSNRLHWWMESSRRREAITSAIARFDLTHMVAVARPMDPKRQERARRLCLQVLLYELDQMGVRQVAIERRHEKQDKRDYHISFSFVGQLRY